VIKLDSVVLPTGVSDIDVVHEVSIYPNPSGGDFTIVSGSVIDILKVTNLVGQLVFEATPSAKRSFIQLTKQGFTLSA
jgi:hypothetical protein